MQSCQNAVALCSPLGSVTSCRVAIVSENPIDLPIFAYSRDVITMKRKTFPQILDSLYILLVGIYYLLPAYARIIYFRKERRKRAVCYLLSLYVSRRNIYRLILNSKICNLKRKMHELYMIHPLYIYLRMSFQLEKYRGDPIFLLSNMLNIYNEAMHILRN